MTDGAAPTSKATDFTVNFPLAGPDAQERPDGKCPGRLARTSLRW